MTRIAICDDEEICRGTIKEILTDYLEENDILYEIDEFTSGKALVSLGIELAKYNIVFLDINMSELDGMKAAYKIREFNEEIFIVFVTAFINYTLEGYKVNAIRYILKNNTNMREMLIECMDAISRQTNCKAQRRTFHFNEVGERAVSLNKLLYIESHLHRLEFHIMEDKLTCYAMYGKLDELEQQLHGAHFVRIHQSYLVNLIHVDKISRYTAVLDNGIRLEIPKARYKFVEEAFVSYKGEL